MSIFIYSPHANFIIINYFFHLVDPLLQHSSHAIISVVSSTVCGFLDNTSYISAGSFKPLTNDSMVRLVCNREPSSPGYHFDTNSLTRGANSCSDSIGFFLSQCKVALCVSGSKCSPNRRLRAADICSNEILTDIGNLATYCIAESRKELIK